MRASARPMSTTPQSHASMGDCNMPAPWHTTSAACSAAIPAATRARQPRA